MRERPPDRTASPGDSPRFTPAAMAASRVIRPPRPGSSLSSSAVSISIEAFMAAPSSE